MDSVKNMKKSDFLLPEESRLLNKTIKIREEIVDEFIKDGVPTNNRDVRVINELLNSIDNVVLGKVDRRLKHSENESNNNINNDIKNILLKISNDLPAIENKELDTKVPELDDSEIVDGEMEDGEIELDKEKFSL